jgi:hypothetical protein
MAAMTKNSESAKVTMLGALIYFVSTREDTRIWNE